MARELVFTDRDAYTMPGQHSQPTPTSLKQNNIVVDIVIVVVIVPGRYI